MTTSSPPSVPNKGTSKMLIVGIIVAVVAIAAIAGAYILMNNDTGSSDQNNNDNNNNTGTNDTIDQFELKNGDYMIFTTTSESVLFNQTITTKWVVSNVTSDGYDITINVTSEMFSYENTVHVDRNETIGAGATDENYTRGTLIGVETISTPFGDKQVEHWRYTSTSESTTTVIDYYVGENTKMVYKWVSTTTDSNDPNNNSTSTMELSSTNIVVIDRNDEA